MLEIIVVISMCRFLHKKATEKGWPGWPFILTMIFGWLAFAIGGGILGLVVFGDDGDLPVAGIVGYLLGAVFACVSNTMLVMLLPNRKPETDDEDEEYDRRRRRRRYADDDRDDEDDRRDRRERRSRDRDDRDEDLDDRNWRPRRRDDDR